MDTKRLGFSPEQQSQIDNVFVDTALSALTPQVQYCNRANLLYTSDIADELESIHARVFDQAHSMIIAGDEISPIITGLIGKLAFIDSLALPSSEKVDRKQKVARALGDFMSFRRLFRGLPHTELSV